MSYKEDEKRLYFIVRSWIMGQIGGVLFLSAVLILGKIDFFQAIIVGAFVFFLSLSISRIFDSQIGKGTRKILKFLDKHSKLRKFILKYL